MQAAYQVLPLPMSYSCEMEHEELKAVAVVLWHGGENLAQVIAAFRVVRDGYPR